MFVNKILRLSYSQISCYRECPLQYKFKYIDRLPEKPKHYYFFGSIIHQCLAFLFKSKSNIPSLASLLIFFDLKWRKSKSKSFKNRDEEIKYYQEGRAMLTKFYEKNLLQENPPHPLFVEWKFNIEVKDFLLEGRIDRIDEIEDGIEVIDYKTGGELDIKKVENDEQLKLYQLACQKCIPKKIKFLTIYHLPSSTVLRINSHRSDVIENSIREIISIGENISSGNFPPAPSKKCIFCDYQSHCQYSRKDET